MQSMNSNGPQIVINVCPTVPKQLRYTNMRDDLASKLVALGIVQSVIGIICIILHIILVAAPSAYSFLYFVGHGFWNGTFFIITGIVGIVGGKQRARCQVVTLSVLSILAICFATSLLGISVSSAVLTDVTLSGSANQRMPNGTVGGVVLESLLAFLGFTEVITAMVSSAICCSVGACCCDCDGCCCPLPSISNQVITIDPATFGQLSGIAINADQGLDPKTPVVTFSPGQGLNPSNQVQRMVFSNQQPMFPHNASLSNEAFNSQPPPEHDNPDSNVDYTKLRKDHQYTHLTVDPSYE